MQILLVVLVGGLNSQQWSKQMSVSISPRNVPVNRDQCVESLESSGGES